LPLERDALAVVQPHCTGLVAGGARRARRRV